MARAPPRTRAERAAERQKAERRAKASCHRAAVNGVEGAGGSLTGILNNKAVWATPHA